MYSDKQLMDQRAGALAYLYLTEDKNVRVIEGKIEEYPFDYLVRVRNDSRSIVAQFGVEVVGVLWNRQGDDKIEIELPIVKERRSFDDCGLPICLFVFFMHTNQGYYRWLREPISEGASGLRNNPDGLFRRLDKETLTGIIAQAREWYTSGNMAVK